MWTLIVDYHDGIGERVEKVRIPLIKAGDHRHGDALCRLYAKARVACRQGASVQILGRDGNLWAEDVEGKLIRVSDGKRL